MIMKSRREKEKLNIGPSSEGGTEDTQKAPQHGSFDSVLLPVRSALLGDRMDPLCQVAHICGSHARHGNPAVFGHVHRELLRQALNLQEK